MKKIRRLARIFTGDNRNFSYSWMIVLTDGRLAVAAVDYITSDGDESHWLWNVTAVTLKHSGRCPRRHYGGVVVTRSQKLTWSVIAKAINTNTSRV